MPLYKYVTPELVVVIQNLSIRFSPPSAFNDPFESLPDTKFLETKEWIDEAKTNVVRELSQALSHLSERSREEVFLQRYAERLQIYEQDALTALRELAAINRILCLSKVAPKDPGALLLWAHYTENHSGMVFEFDDNHAWVRRHDFKPGEAHDCASVIYSSKRAGCNWDPTRGWQPAEEFLYTKSEHWIYEQEVRLMRFVGDKDFVASKVDALVRFPADLLRSVTLGVNNRPRKRFVML